MKLVKGITPYTQIATVFFILGKLMFLPVVISMFSEDSEFSAILLAIYCILILLSIFFSLYSMKKEHRNKTLDDLSSYNDGSFLIKIKDGKIIEVS